MCANLCTGDATIDGKAGRNVSTLELHNEM